MNTKRFSLLATLLACLLSLGSSPAAHAQTTMHVSAVAIDHQVNGGDNRRHLYSALVTVLDESSNPVAGVTVSGSFSGCFLTTATGVTNASGVALLVGNIVRCGSHCTVTVVVTGVVKAGMSYNSGANVSSGASSAIAACYKKQHCTICGFGKLTAKENNEATSAFSSTTSPNPLSDYAVIRFSLEEPAATLVRIWSVSGVEMAVLADADLVAGEHAYVWTGTDHSNAKVAPGTYFYSIESNGEIKTGTIVVAR